MTIAIEPIRGKIARVLSTRDVAINRGDRDGVAVGMVFNILSTKGGDIKDPDTGEELGSVELVKTSVKIKAVYERVSVASTYRSQTVNVGGSGIALTGLFTPPKWETRVETLKVNDNNIQDLEEREAFVNTGDPVVLDLEATRSEQDDQT